MSIYKKTINSFAGRVAVIIDKSYLKNSPSVANKVYEFALRRVLWALFTLGCAYELVKRALTSLGYGLLSLAKKQVSENLKVEVTLLSNALITTLLSILGGWVYPKMIAIRYLVTDKANKAIASSKIYQSDCLVEKPKNLDALLEIVKEARLNYTNITVRGAGASQGRQFLPAQNEKAAIMLDLSELNQIIDINQVEKTVTVQAGATWANIQQVINRLGLSLKVMQASNIFSVGGSISANIHGWDHQAGTLSEVVKEITLINANGEIQTITPKDELFSYVLGGYGQFGIILSAKLELCDNDLLTEVSTLVPIKDYVNHFRNTIEPNNDENKMHLYRLSLDPKALLKEGVSVTYVKAKDQLAPAKMDWVDEKKKGDIVSRVLLHGARNLRMMRKYYWKLEKNRLLNNQETKTRNQWMHPEIEAMFNDSQSEAEWLQEYFIPQQNLSRFLDKMSDLLIENSVRLCNASVRFVKADNNTVMAYAPNEDRFALVLCFSQDLDHDSILKTKIWVQKAIDLALEHGGTYYLPYQAFAKPEQFNQSYPHAIKTMAAKIEFDAGRMFQSGMVEQYLTPKEQDVLANYRANLQNEAYRIKFKGFFDNILMKVDADKFYPLILKVMQHSVSWGDAYNELQRELTSVSYGPLKSLKMTLRSLSTIKEDLSKQAKLHIQALGPLRQLQGYLEIGYPGRFIKAIKAKLNVKKPIYVLNEQELLSDYVQTQSLRRPYDRFFRLDYFNAKNSFESLLKEENLGKEQLDLVSCFVGLHHFPEKNLPQILTVLNKILRIGGHFLLLDHDAANREGFDMAMMAHSFYNITTGVPYHEEASEIRNFQALVYWKESLERSGFECSQTPPMLREGDPSLNSMICFTKIHEVNQLNPDIKLDDEKQEVKPHPIKPKIR